MIKVVFVEPGEKPIIKEIGSSLKSMRTVLGGNLQVFGPFSGSIYIVYSQEAESAKLPLNIQIINEDAKVSGAIYGSFFICQKVEKIFAGLSEAQLTVYAEMLDKGTAHMKFNGKWITLKQAASSPSRMEVKEVESFFQDAAAARTGKEV